VREVAGYVLIAQALITGIIVYAIAQLGDSIKEAAAYTAGDSGQLMWGGGIPLLTLAALVIVAGMGTVLVIRGKKASH
jgi:hypothetical protein